MVNSNMAAKMAAAPFQRDRSRGGFNADPQNLKGSSPWEAGTTQRC